MDELEEAQRLLEETQILASSEKRLSRVCQKLSRKIKADASFLEKFYANGGTKENDKKGVLSSSNIPYLSGVLKVVKESGDVQEVICDLRKYGIIVDVVCNSGKTWKKVIARNPQSLHLIWAGKGQYGTKDVVKKAEKYLESAKLYCEFSPPRVVCVFCNGVTHEMAEHLESKGISVEGERLDVSQEMKERLSECFVADSDDSDEDDLFEQARKLQANFLQFNQAELTDADKESEVEVESKIVTDLRNLAGDEKIFLDITTMLVHVSDVCNGGCDFEFQEKILAEQAAAERSKSALDSILPYMEGKTLITCQSALDDYKGIVDLLGGEDEKARAQILINQLTIVPDCVSRKFGVLAESGQIKGRSKIIFGSADMLRCDILTSNEGFVRAAAGQGIHIPAMLHEPRALSEQKKLGEMSKIHKH